ncbi:MAG: L-lactate dehydrogenase [Acidimicrobiales bacterium]|nr:L-lactate dehydrogenase [Acidimicrobiales bacterium]
MRLSPDRPLGLAPATVSDYRELARRRLPRSLFDYIDGGASAEHTLAANVADLADIQLRQRVMRDVSERVQATTVLGEALSSPVILAPVGLAGMYAKRAEVQAARAARKAGVPFTESTVSICGLDEVAAAAGAPWFQLYVQRDRDVTASLIEKAGEVGCPVLVMTVDLAVVGARHRDTRNAMTGNSKNPLVAARRAMDLVSHPRWMRDVAIGGKPHTFGNLESVVPGARTPMAFRRWVDHQFDPSVTWEDISWVRSHWDGKLVVKGVLDPDDAKLAVEAGVDGIVVSNHGGRQLDTVPSTAAALPAVAAAVGDQVEVLVDGGVRTGIDVVKMLALGAKACLVGRAWAWAVAARGEAGVAHMLKGLKADIDTALALTGTNDVADLTPDCLVGGGD